MSSFEPLRVEGAVPGSYVEIQPSRSGDWHIRVCEGLDPDNMKTGAVAEFPLPVGFKIFGSGKTSNNSQLGTAFMHALADFYNKHSR